MSCEIVRTNRLKGLPPGSIVAGKYRIDEILAEGGMGIIYRGWHLVLDQPVAVKVMRPELVDRPEASLRFLNEARAAACLRGSNVARVLDSGAIEVSGTELLYIVLEYLEGADLRTVLEQKGALTVERTVDFILQACEGLAEAHCAGIVHRDVKPENLFLTRQPDGTEIIKLLDFGISKRVDSDPLSERADSQSLGSPHYMAPEQMSAPHAVDMRADIWSLGIVAYELLTLRVPFDGETVATLCAQVLGREPVPTRTYSPAIPEEVDRAILGCLAKDRTQRHPSVRELAVSIAPFGSSKAQESLRRIQRLFDRQSQPPAPIDIDIDLSHLDRPLRHEPERTGRLVVVPTPRYRSQSADIDLTMFDRPRRSNVVGRVGLAAAAAVAALAIVLPGRSTIAAVSSKTWEAISPLGERARVVAEHPSVQLSRLFPRDGDASVVAVTPGPEVEKLPPARAAAPVVRTAINPQNPTVVRQRTWQPARVRGEEAGSEPASRPAPAAASASEVPDKLIAPYEDRVEKPRGFRDGSRKNLDIAASRYGLGEGEFASADINKPVNEASP